MKFLKRSFLRFKWNIEASFRLGSSLTQKLKFLLISFWLPLPRLLHLGRKSYRVRIRMFNREADCYLTDGSDFEILRGVFLDKEYDIDPKAPPKNILDLGSNVGMSVIFFKLKYPDARIVAVEADPDTVEKLKKNTSQFRNVAVINAAISGSNGPATFYRGPASMASSLLPRWGEKIVVEGKTIDTITSDADLSEIDLLKFDIEGAEMNSFQVFNNLPHVACIVGEYHEDLTLVKPTEFAQLFADFEVSFRARAPQRYIFEAIRNR